MAARIWAEQLMIYAKDDPDFAKNAESFKAENPAGNMAESAYSVRDFSLILNRYNNLKQINFYTHGNVGYAYLGGGSLSKTNVSLLTPPHTALFQGAGRVLFVGCNIGEGEVGRAFLVAAGQTLLKGHGGIIGATTSFNMSARWGLLDIYKPLWGKLRLIQLDSSGQVIAEKLV
jgi:hypothetical protein